MSHQRSVTFNHNPLLEQDLPVWRARLVLLVLLLGSFTLVGRALYLQVMNNTFLQAKGESRYSRVIEVSATRGRITDRNGEVLAVSTPVSSIWAIPPDAKLSPSEVRQLAALLEMNVLELNQRLGSNHDFVYLKRQVMPEVAQKIAALKLSGIHQQQEFRRYYPVGEVVAHMLGFTGVEDRGQEGIELAYEKLLAGVPGSRRVIKDRRGQVIEEADSIRPPRDGENISLAIDSKIQYMAHVALRDAIDLHQAKAGAVVVLDVRSGEVLALANAPTYNPNNRISLVGAQLRNRALTDSFEPGSVMKPLIVGLALESGKFKATTKIDTSPGKITIGSATISDTKRHGVLSVSEIIQKSSNVGMAKIALEFAPTEMWQFFQKIGFGAPLNLGFPGEVGGRVRPAKSWRPIEQVTMSYGHGISVTLIQMARAYLVFAREGELPLLSLTRVDEPWVKGEQIFSPETVRNVRAMLEMAVAPGGTALKAQVQGYRVAGKTGTAYKIEGGKYTKKYISSFVGFAPASNPRLVVAVMVDEPSVAGHFGGTVAAPVFSRIMEGALRSLGVAPDAPLTPLQIAGNTVERSACEWGGRCE